MKKIFKNKKSKIKSIFWIVLLFSIGLHLVLYILSKYIFLNWTLIHEPLHAAVEVLGSVAALIVARILITQNHLGKGTQFNIWISGALIGMGILDGFHGVSHVGNVFVWLHSLATFIGGLLFNFIWLNESHESKVAPFWNKIILLLAILLGILSLSFPSLIPIMIVQGSFTEFAIFLNVSGGIFLISAALRMYLKFKEKENIDDLLFFLHCLLFGLAAIMFMESKIWDFAWWSWHVLRALAYSAAIYFCYLIQLKIENDLFDIKVKKEISPVVEKLQFLLNATNMGTWEFNVSEQKVEFDNKMSELFQTNKNVLKLEEWLGLITYMSRDQLKLEVDVSADEKNDELRIEIISNDLIKKFVRIKSQKIDDDKIVGLCWDITNDVEIENKLGRAKDIAENALAAKDNFLASMSHEIRTPLNGIIGFTNLLCEKDLGEENNLQIKLIKNCGDTLLSLINDILDISKLDADKIFLDEHDFNLEDVIISAVNVFKTLVIEKNIQLTYEIANDVPLSLLGDSVRLKQILVNLIGNAVKFTSKGFVKIIIKEITRSSKNVNLMFSVLDTGIGIAYEAQDKLFKRFEQLDSSITREYGGSGLGLSICLRLVKLLGGEIFVESEVGKGAKFEFCLSFKINKLITNNVIALENEDAFMITKKYEILLVEDNKINQIVARKTLESIGLRLADIADNGKIAVEKVLFKKYDIIFMDIQMPIMDGYQATREIRLIAPNVTIIDLSANAFEEDRKKAFEVGMNYYLEKPFNKDKLRDVIMKIHTNKKA